jgi:hypothetical protein
MKFVSIILVCCFEGRRRMKAEEDRSKDRPKITKSFNFY